MKKDKWYKVIHAYGKENRKVLLAFTLSIMIFIVVFYLYSLPLESVVYGGSLSATVFILIGLYDFYLYNKKHKTIQDSVRDITVGLVKLPKATTLLEKDYQSLICVLNENTRNLISQADGSRSNMIDYYTLWAHQIKTPITAMRILLQSEHVEGNKDLLSELFKIEQYVEMVLQYLRLEHISSDLQFREHNLDDLIRQSVKKYAQVFIHKKIKLEYDETSCIVLTDEKWLVFVIEQLLSNALKYTTQGKIAIYMDKNTEKTVIIEDTGIGIQEEDLPRVFDKGFTGYNGRTDKKSTGIGLYLCKQVINKLSHTMTITSQVNYGTKVMIDLSSVDTFIE